MKQIQGGVTAAKALRQQVWRLPLNIRIVKIWH